MKNKARLQKIMNPEEYSQWVQSLPKKEIFINRFQHDGFDVQINKSKKTVSLIINLQERIFSCRFFSSLGFDNLDYWIKYHISTNKESILSYPTVLQLAIRDLNLPAE